jgi:signal transduction histidine kinase
MFRVEAGDSTTVVEPSAVRGVRLARIIRASITVTVVVNVAYLAALLLPGDPAPVLVDIWLSELAQWAAVGVFWLVAVRTGFTRWEVILAAAGVTFNAAGDTFYSFAMDSSGNLPSPSIADIGYLLYYPLTLAALVVLVRRQSRGTRESVIFDSTLAALGASAVLAMILGPVFTDATAGASAMDGAIAALYPLFDLLLIAVVVGIFASPALRIGPRWQMLVLGLLLITGADIAYALLTHTGAYDAGGPLDAAWTAGVALSAFWVNGVDRRHHAEPVARSSFARTLPVPAMAVLAGLGVLLIDTQTPVPVFALALAAMTVALAAVPVMFRHATLARLLEGRERVVEQLTALDEAKSDMIGTVSHEMRTPLSSVLGYLELVLDDDGGPVPTDAKDMLRVAQRNARRLQSLVGNMTMMTNLESGDGAPPLAPTPLARVLGRVGESLRPFAESRGVALTVACDDSVVVHGNDSQLEQVFTNLVENALKFTSATGSVRIEVVEGATRGGEPAALVSVTDTGMGVPEGELPQLFDRFFRASNAKENVLPGTGLGLSIVRGIVQAHEGDVAVASVLGEGTTFIVALPTDSAGSGAGRRQAV